VDSARTDASVAALGQGNGAWSVTRPWWVEVRRLELHCACPRHPRSGGWRSDLRYLPTPDDRCCPLLSAVCRSAADPARTEGSGSVWSRTPPALQSLRDQGPIGRPGTARPIQAWTTFMHM
jgi:hypothetical protein